MEVKSDGMQQVTKGKEGQHVTKCKKRAKCKKGGKIQKEGDNNVTSGKKGE